MRAVFLDLDGTLTDPKPGIVRSVLHALTTLGHDAPPDDDLSWVIGPALVDSFARLGVEDIDRALALYRACYSGGAMFEARLFEGIVPALASLQAAGCDLYLATAKPHEYARQVTAHFGLTPFFVHEFGPELDGTRNDKGELLAHALALTGLDPSTCVMVGDRHHDIDAARAVGMASIAVGWGYGRPGEHQLATALCAEPAALPEAIAALFSQGARTTTSNAGGMPPVPSNGADRSSS